MTKQTLKIVTPVGEFTRTTHATYTHVVLRQGQWTKKAYETRGPGRETGVQGRFIKDRGYATTWHGSEQAARKAAMGPYGYDTTAAVIGIFPVVTN